MRVPLAAALLCAAVAGERPDAGPLPPRFPGHGALCESLQIIADAALDDFAHVQGPAQPPRYAAEDGVLFASSLRARGGACFVLRNDDLPDHACHRCELALGACKGARETFDRTSREVESCLGPAWHFDKFTAGPLTALKAEESPDGLEVRLQLYRLKGGCKVFLDVTR